MEHKGGTRMGTKKSKGKGGHQNYWSKKIVTTCTTLLIFDPIVSLRLASNTNLMQ
jgi:hypothetical protein